MTDNQLDGIAIIGLTGRFPGASDVEEFWRNLVAGVESISTFTDEELAAAGLDPAEVKKIPDYVRARGILKDADCFDAAFFGINPKEAEATDPQQRAFLEAAWSALESAGYAPDTYRGSIGLFAGMTNNTYYLQNLHGRRDVTQLVGWLTTMMGNEKDYLATRVAYKLNLKGPALNVYTACSTSLVAVCQAVQSLQNFSCDIALAGAVSITFPQHRGYQFQEGGIVSPDGHCRPFDAKAAGTVFSHGLGAVVLKRLAEAVADGDQIYAVIKGAALNNDGSNKVSFTAPSVDGQAEVVALAQGIAGIEPDSISYVEAHGTGTPLGDPIEVAALTQAFRAKTAKKNFCGLGTVKSNIGHLDAAAGIAGLIKTALALKHKVLPPTLHYTQPNPKLELPSSPFYIVDKLTPWKTDGAPLRAGVSSFGVGGTNSHVVLEEAPALEPSSASRAAQLILLSAKSPESLDAATANLARHFKAHPETNLADAAYTLQVGRSSFAQRRVLACRDAAEAAVALETCDTKKIFSGQNEAVNPPVVFMFPGQGAQYVNMGVELYRSEPSFKADVDQCAEILKPHVGLDLRDVLYPAAEKLTWAEEQLIQTRVTQPALFVIEYALAKLWMSWGVKPAAMIGHSVGEYVAGCLAGVFTLKEGLELVAGRARLVQAQPPGTMLAVRLSEAEVLPLLGKDLSIAAINSPNLCVVSGPHDAVAKLEAELEAKKIVGRRLHTSHAFHSAMMDPVLPPFTELLKKVRLNAPKIPYVSNVTAKWVTEKETTDPNYWAGHVRQAVRFADGVGELLKNQQYVMLEVGPGQTLTQLARQHPAKGANQTILSSLATAKEQGAELSSFLTTLGRLWIAGVQPDWTAFYANERRHRVALPTYAFEKKRHWVEPNRAVTAEIIPWASPPAGSAIGTSEACATPSPAVATLPTTNGSTAETSDAQLPRKDRILKLLKMQLSELSGMDAAKLNPVASFLELGFDSLFLTQASLAFQNRYGVKVTFRQMLEDLPTLSDLAAYLDSKLPGDALPAAAQTKPATAATAPASTGSGIKVSAPAETAPIGQKYFGPFKPIDVGASGGLTERQQKHLDALIARYTKRTAGSKKTTQEHRVRFADPRAAAGFKQLWKEMVYPIVAARSQGAKIWDVDGNEYIDITLGFGLGLLGHRPSFVVEAIEKQLALGMEIGPASPLAGKVAELMCEFSGQERVTFCNTGSEAVTAALRVTRTVSGRNKVVMFTGSYHGIFDEVLVRPQVVNGELRSIPIAPGIAPEMVANMVVLEYGSDQALEILRKHGHEIAAVLVEPVQSRRPEFQPREFLQQLRQITESTGTALIFDETVTGFRCHPGGAQAWFGIKADLSTYGKVVGGGLPIGVCCGRAHYMDALDGGKWQYGDASFPEVGVTFFAGTFVRHPLALAAAQAVLTHLKEQGPQLQETLNQRAEKMVDELNRHFTEIGVPIRLNRFSSMYYVSAAPELKYSSLLFYHLREKGLHIWEGRPSFLSVVHTEQDIAYIIRAFKESVAELQSGGFFPETSSHKDNAATPGESMLVPMTEVQKELWLGAQMGDDASRAFNDSFVVQMRGNLKLDLLCDTLQLLVDRHDSLRTTFPGDGKQRIAPHFKLEIPLTDLSVLPAAERDAKLAKAIHELESRTFDLVRGPLIRAEIIKLGGSHHALLMATHHIAVDGWSVGVLLHELSKHYTAVAQGMSSPLQPALQFADYAKWQSSAVYHDAVRAAEDFWFQKFADRPAAVDLPTDRKRPALKTYRSGQEGLMLGPDVYKTLKQAAAKERCTLLTYLLGAFDVWLHRVTKQQTLVVGIPAAGQIAGEVQSLPGNRALVGHCVNLLPMRTECRSDMTFAEFLTGLKTQTLDAYEHQSFTFGTLIKEMKLPRDPSRIPLVSLTFNVDRAYSGFQLHGLETHVESPAKRFNVFDVGVNIVDFDTELRVDFRYNSDLFDASTVQRWLSDWKSLLQEIAANPGMRLGATTGSSGTPAKAVSTVVAAIVNGTSIPAEFEKQVAATPDAIAVVFGNERLTYRNLNSRANRLAHHLRTLGVGADTLVGLCAERSVELIVSLVAILKAGGAYLPLDPNYPKDRLAFMLEDTQAPVLLTQRKLASSLPQNSGKIVYLDAEDLRNLNGVSDSNPSTIVGPENLAYVMYTSGSTGRPKGTLIPHRGVVRLVKGADYARFATDEVFLQCAPISFDASTFEVWGALLNGARLAVLSPGSNSLEELGRAIRENSVTTLWLTAGLFHQMVDERLEDLRPLRQLLSGGDVLSVAHVKKALKGLPGCRLVNGYGPTENTTFTCCHAISERDCEGASIPIGRPISRTEVYILDEQLRPVTSGNSGELHIAGEGLARGYLNQPELTAQKFIKNPWAQSAQDRMYKTGDLCRWRADGTVEFIGRIDQQVKIRGFRIELGEIESVLGEHANIRDAVVTARADAPGEKRLVAYLIVRDGAKPELNGLREHLKAKLPDYMVPSAFVVLEKFPLNPNGKVDRAALPAPEGLTLESEAAFVAPESPVEKYIAETWMQLLRVERVGVHDNFFELGGHSLLATQVASRLRDAFGVELPLARVLSAPTITQLALLVEDVLREQIEQLDEADAERLAASNPTDTK